MTAPYQLPPIFLQLTAEEAFFFAKLIMPEGSPPEALSDRAKIILALKVARRIDTGLPLSEPLWEEPARNHHGKSGYRRKIYRRLSSTNCVGGSGMMFEIAAFLFWLIVIVGLIAIIVITPIYTSHIAPS